MQFRIVSLTLTNFMRFDKQKFEFNKDLALVIGSNGSGKSSLLEALALSFQLKERGSSVTKYIRKGTKTAEVELEAIWLGKPLKIKSIFLSKGPRKIKRVVEYNGETMEDTLANNFLSAHFKEQQNVISFALQGAERFITPSKAKNLQNLTDLLQIDFNKELDYTKGLIKELNTKRANLVSELNKQQGAKDTLSESIKNTRSALDACNKYLEENPDNGLSTSTIAGAETKIIELKTRLSVLQNAQSKYNEEISIINNLQNAISSDTAKIDSDKKELVKFENAGEVIDFSSKETEKEQLTIESKTYSEREKELLNKKGSVQAKIDIEKKRYSLIQDGTCPTCLQKLSDGQLVSFKSSLEDLEKEIAEISNEATASGKSFEEVSQRIQNLRKEIDDIKIHNNNVNYNKSMKDRLQKEIEDAEARITQNKSHLERAQKNLQSFEDAGEVQSLLSQIQELEALKNKTLEFQNTRRMKENDKVHYENYLKDFEKNVLNCESQISAISKEIENLEKDFMKWSRVQTIFTEIPKVHMKKVIEDVEAVCNSIVTEFGYKELKIEVDDKGIDFYLCYWPLPDVEDADISYEMCSTFEKNLVNISLIYALANMFKVPFVCIDELDANSDEKNTRKLGKLILRMLKSVPVVAVSHDPKLMEDLLQDSKSISILKMEEKNERPDE